MIIDLDTSLIHFPHATFGLRALEPIIFRARFGVKSDGALIFALGFAFQLPFTSWHRSLSAAGGSRYAYLAFYGWSFGCG